MKTIQYRLTAWGNWAGTRVGTEYPVSSCVILACADGQ